MVQRNVKEFSYTIYDEYDLVCPFCSQGMQTLSIPAKCQCGATIKVVAVKKRARR